MALTKILATIGPASLSVKTIKQLIANGASGFRINTAHGDFQQYEKIIKAIRSCGTQPIILDIKGPELRLRNDEPITLVKGKTLFFSFNKKDPIHFSHPVRGDIKKGDVLLFADGQFKAVIKTVHKNGLSLTFKSFGELGKNKTVAIPGRDIKLPALSKKDKEAITFAKKHDIEYIALSFTRNAQDVKRVLKLLNNQTGIIAKIENQQGVDNAEDILRYASGIMVARGDLGVEIQQEHIPGVQKKLLRLCNEQGKLGIVATQVLESMVSNPVQTRAETTDIATAVLDGADCIMLSEETALGKYPVECVKTISTVAGTIEEEFRIEGEYPARSISQSISVAAASFMHSNTVDKLVAITKSGYSARQVARFRLRKPLLAVTESALVASQLNLYFGVHAYHYTPSKHKIHDVVSFLLKKKEISLQTTLLVVAGLYVEDEPQTNTLHVFKVKDIKLIKK